LHNVIVPQGVFAGAPTRKISRTHAIVSKTGVLQPLFPATFVAWEDYVWNSLRLSRLEIEAVRIHTTTQDEKAIRAIFPNQREYDEWTAKRRTLFGK
jgi:hypothetical protein